MAFNIARQLGIATNKQAKSAERLSTGYRINRSADDAAGLSISEKMRAQIRGLDQASENAQDGISLLQTAEGAMSEIQSSLQRIRELYVQNCNDTNTSADREAIWNEATSLYSEINRVAHDTEYNGMKLLDGTYSAYPDSSTGTLTGDFLKFQVGANSNQSISVSIPKFITDSPDNFIDYDIFVPSVEDGSGSIGFSLSNYLDDTPTAKGYFTDPYGVDFSSHQNQMMIMGGLDYSINKVSEARSAIGAVSNRLEHVISNSENTSENLQAAESRIRDTDIADEMVQFSKMSILIQVGQSLLSQANKMPEQVLSLLQ
jgi:flagellin